MPSLYGLFIGARYRRAYLAFWGFEGADDTSS